MKYFVTSDVHSFYSILISSLEGAGFEIDNPSHILVIAGDLFDRGEESAECLQFVKTLAAQNRFIYIRGNHEDLLFDCVRDIERKIYIGYHHISNGTISTISHLTGISEFDLIYETTHYSSKIREKLQEVLQFIEETSVDYYELGDYIIVHGWLPTISDKVDPNWKTGDWDEARWKNGMEEWSKNYTLPEKTVVCGHWHTSWGWSHLRRQYKEWNPKSKTCFKPFIDNGIVALDACVAYTSKLNVVVIDQDEKGGVKLEQTS